jgi:hypothetical protein
MEQHIRYCTSADGTRIAYAVAGKGSPLVRAGTVFRHVERDWESRLWSHPLRRLARRHKIVALVAVVATVVSFAAWLMQG